MVAVWGGILGKLSLEQFLNALEKRSTPRQDIYYNYLINATVIAQVRSAKISMSGYPLPEICPISIQASWKMLPVPLIRRIRLSLAPLKAYTKNRTVGLICPFLPPRVFVKCPATRKMDGRGGGDRKFIPIKQVLSCQRRSTTALLPIGVKWCQPFLGASALAASECARSILACTWRP